MCNMGFCQGKNDVMAAYWPIVGLKRLAATVDSDEAFPVPHLAWYNDFTSPQFPTNWSGSVPRIGYCYWRMEHQMRCLSHLNGAWLEIRFSTYASVIVQRLVSPQERKDASSNPMGNGNFYCRNGSDWEPLKTKSGCGQWKKAVHWHRWHVLYDTGEIGLK